MTRAWRIDNQVGKLAERSQISPSRLAGTFHSIHRDELILNRAADGAGVEQVGKWEFSSRKAKGSL